jgi:hypothetical protein
MSSLRNNKVSGGVDRTFESIDVRHPHYPVAVYLFGRERFYNLVRHHATDVRINFQENENGSFTVSMMDNGDGNADPTRLLEPAEDSGMSSSKYGFGERILRLKMSTRHAESMYAWKKADDLYYTELLQTATGYQIKHENIDTVNPVWKNKSDSGFFSKIAFIPDRLDGRTTQEVVPILRSILCMSLTPEVLAKLHIHIEVRDTTGTLLREIVPPGKPTKSGKPRKTREPHTVGLSDSKDNKWKSLIEILRENPLDGLIRETEGTLSSGATIKVEYLRLAPSSTKYYEGVREYTDSKASGVLVVMHGFVMPIPLPEALGKAPHPASQNGRFAIVTVTPAEPNIAGLSEIDAEIKRQESMPSQASSKVTFLASCPVYQDMLRFIRSEKPASWDAFVKKASSDTDASSATESDASSVDVPNRRIKPFQPWTGPSVVNNNDTLVSKLRDLAKMLESVPSALVAGTPDAELLAAIQARLRV